MEYNQTKVLNMDHQLSSCNNINSSKRKLESIEFLEYHLKHVYR